MLITYQLKGTDLTLKSFIQSFKDKVSLFINLGVIIGLTMFIYIPFINNIANTISLELKWWILIISLTLLAVLPFDILKIINRRSNIDK